ncbi:MAG: DNA polymerase, partial [Flavisolibacter sp.]|nr:DNA polymerase [Flavisolibacter sp.]
YQMLLHLFNHGTYHRGQLVNMLRQLEVSPIPQTDFIVWSRRKK